MNSSLWWYISGKIFRYWGHFSDWSHVSEGSLTVPLRCHTVPTSLHPQIGGKCFRVNDWQKPTNNTSLAPLPHGSQQLPRYSFLPSPWLSLSPSLSIPLDSTSFWLEICQNLCFALHSVSLFLSQSAHLCLCVCLTIFLCLFQALPRHLLLNTAISAFLSASASIT